MKLALAGLLTLLRRNVVTLLSIALVLCAFGAFAQEGHEAHGAAPHEAVAGGAPLDAHTDAVHGGAAHDEHQAGAPELPNFISVLLETNSGLRNSAFGHFLHTYEKQVMLLIVTCLLAFFVFRTLRMRAQIPGKFQTAVEMLVEGLFNFFEGILGAHARKYVPFFATLFLFIWVNNLIGIVPGFASANSVYSTTLALALIVFFYVQYYAIKEGGIGHYLWHLAGSPRDKIGWAMVPLLFPLEVIGTLAKPLSLSLRLFGNIMGEDILVGVFLLLGVGLMGVVWPNPLIGIPLHLPFLFLALLTSTVQALVFTLLGCIYLALVLPHHDDEHGSHAHEHESLPGADDETNHVEAGAGAFIG